MNFYLPCEIWIMGKGSRRIIHATRPNITSPLTFIDKVNTRRDFNFSEFWFVVIVGGFSSNCCFLCIGEGCCGFSFSTRASNTECIMKLKKFGKERVIGGGGRRLWKWRKVYNIKRYGYHWAFFFYNSVIHSWRIQMTSLCLPFLALVI